MFCRPQQFDVMGKSVIQSITKWPNNQISKARINMFGSVGPHMKLDQTNYKELHNLFVFRKEKKKNNFEHKTFLIHPNNNNKSHRLVGN